MSKGSFITASGFKELLLEMAANLDRRALSRRPWGWVVAWHVGLTGLSHAQSEPSSCQPNPERCWNTPSAGSHPSSAATASARCETAFMYPYMYFDGAVVAILLGEGGGFTSLPIPAPQLCVKTLRGSDCALCANACSTNHFLGYKRLSV